MSKRQIETLLGSWHLELSVGDVGNSGSGSYGQGSVRGGGGGFYGGGASYTIGGGGGSGYLEGVPNFIYVEGTEYKPETQNGVNEGNGRACITFVGTSEYEEKTVNTEYCYDRENKNLLASFSDEGEIVKYVYGNGLISSYTSGDDSAEEPAVSYYLYDLRGSAEHVTDDEGDIVSAYTYSTYGQRTVESGTETPVGYCGRDGVLTEANGLLYMRARYYAPSLQRFVNQDIVVGDISNSSSLNRYSYVEGNPVTMVDPFGLCPKAKDVIGSIFDMDKIHGTLDVLGFIPGLGDACDAINALLYLAEGDMGNAALSALALLPLGDLLKGGKYTAKIVGKLDDIGGAVFKYLGKNGDNLLSTASKKVDDVLSFASKKCDNFFNFFRKQSDELVEAVAKHGDDAVDSVLKTSYGKSSGNCKNSMQFMDSIDCKNGNYFTDKATIDEIGRIEAKGEDFSILNKSIQLSRLSTEGGTSIVYKYSDSLGTKYMIHEVTDNAGNIIHRDFDAVRIASGQLINKLQ